MPNALQMTPPPAPNPQTQDQAQAQQPIINPAPSHAQTVAGLRHFQTVGRQLVKLLENPDLGKADLRDSMIDATTRLVADHIIPAAQAVTLLGQFPDRPFDQKKWLENAYVQNMAAQIALLDHHRTTNPGTGNLALEMAQNSDTTDNHLQTMQGMMQNHYGMR